MKRIIIYAIACFAVATATGLTVRGCTTSHPIENYEDRWGPLQEVRGNFIEFEDSTGQRYLFIKKDGKYQYIDKSN